MQASALQSISRCYRLGLRRPAREFPARGFQSARPRRWIGASAAAGGADGGTAVEDTPATKGGKGGKRDLQEAYREVREMLTDPSRLVRAVASGKAKGPDPEGAGSRCDPSRQGESSRWSSTTRIRRSPPTTPAPAATAGPGTPGSTRDGADPSRTGADPSRTAQGGPPGRGPSRRQALRPAATGDRDDRGGALAARDQIGRGRGQPSRSLLANANKGGERAAKKALSHDRQKSGSCPLPTRRHVGVSTKDGSAIKADRRDKYKQVEEFLRLVDAAVDSARTGGHMSHGTSARPTRLVDLGCGNAYLTFGAYALLNRTRGQPLEVVGVDVKRQARETNRRGIRAGVGEGLRGRGGPSPGRIPALRPGERDQSPPGGDQSPPGKSTSEPEVDIVLALHACDTATDEALVRAVRWNAPLTLVAPCCHHDLQTRVRDAPTKRPSLSPTLRHGILRERIGDALTDSFRAHIMRLLGHRVDVVEWIGGEHTPRNTMIRAVRTNARAAPELWRVRRDARALGGDAVARRGARGGAGRGEGGGDAEPGARRRGRRGGTVASR